MRYVYDTEFIEDGRTVDLISIGIVADDGREYYAVNSDAPWDRIKANDWLVRNVVTSLPLSHRASLDTYITHQRNSYPKPSFDIDLDTSDTCVKPHWVIANEVRDFILGPRPSDDLPYVELWADYGAYDHVAFCQLFGTMMDLPEGMPMFTHDIQQEASRLMLSDKDLPQQTDGLHNALADARHAKAKVEFLAGLAS